MLWRERERSLEEKISWDPAGNRTWTLYDTGDIGGPQTVYSMLSRHQPSMWPGYEANINHTVYRISTVVKGVDVMQKERACTLMGSHSRKLGLVLWLISFPDVCVTVLDLIHTRQKSNAYCVSLSM